MPALLVAPDTMTTDRVIGDHPIPDPGTNGADNARADVAPPGAPSTRTRTRSGPQLLTVLIGLVLLSTVFLVALAIVALTDGGDADEERDVATTPGGPRIGHRALSGGA